MPTGTSPRGTSDDSAPLSFSDGVNDITNLLSGLEDDLLNPGSPKEAADKGNDEAGLDEAPDEDLPQIEDEEVETDEAEPAPDDETEQPKDAKGGQFVSDTGKVTLDDGTILTVADLKRNNLFHRDYTRLTTEVRTQEKQLAQDKEYVGKHAEAVATQRQVLAAFMEKYVPKAPSPELARTDPYAYGVQRAEYEEKTGVLNQLYYANQSAAQQQQEAYEVELQKVKQAEAAKLFEKMPHLRDQKKFAEWYSEVGTLMMEEYDFSAEEVNEATDSRFYRMMEGLRRLHAALKKANGKGKPGLPRQVQQGKPRLLAGSNRTVPMNDVTRQRQVFTERLKKTGSLEDAVKKLSTFDL